MARSRTSAITQSISAPAMKSPRPFKAGSIGRLILIAPKINLACTHPRPIPALQHTTATPNMSTGLHAKRRPCQPTLNTRQARAWWGGAGEMWNFAMLNVTHVLRVAAFASMCLAPHWAQAQLSCTTFKERFISGSVQVAMRGEPEGKRAQWTQRYAELFEHEFNRFKAMSDAVAILNRNIETSEMMTKDPDAGPLSTNPHALNLAKLEGILCLLDSQANRTSSRVLPDDPKTTGRGARGGS